jgi:AAA15 family ATPase/GTPase
LVIEEVDNGLHPSRAHFLVDMLKTLGAERNIDVLVTTHNPALLDAAGLAMVPFIVVAHRDDQTGFSQLTQLEEIDQLPKLIASGSLGALSSRGRIEEALKREGEV